MAVQLATTRRLLFVSALGVALLLALLLVVLPTPAESSPSGYPVTIDIRATAKGDQAMPFNFAIQPGHTVVLLIRNHTRDLHTFAIPAIGLNAAVPAGHTTRVTFVAPHYGVYRWYCVPCKFGLHGSHRMGGKVYAWISPDLNIG
jgi:plastocyanin